MKKALHLVLACALVFAVGCSKRSQTPPALANSSPDSTQALGFGHLLAPQHQQITQYYADFNFVVQNSSAADLAIILAYVNYPAGDSTFLKDSRMKDLYEKAVGIISRETSVDRNMATGPRYIGKFDFAIMPVRVLSADEAVVQIETLRIATERVQTARPAEGSVGTQDSATSRRGTFTGRSDWSQSLPSTKDAAVTVDPPSYFEIHRWQLTNQTWMLAASHVVPVNE